GRYTRVREAWPGWPSRALPEHAGPAFRPTRPRLAPHRPRLAPHRLPPDPPSARRPPRPALDPSLSRQASLLALDDRLREIPAAQEQRPHVGQQAQPGLARGSVLHVHHHVVEEGVDGLLHAEELRQDGRVLSLLPALLGPRAGKLACREQRLL